MLDGLSLMKIVSGELDFANNHPAVQNAVNRSYLTFFTMIFDHFDQEVGGYFHSKLTD